jgi:two-component system, LuxR family, response regulator FixJ
MQNGEFGARDKETVFVIDADATTRSQALAILREAGFAAEGFRLCAEFLERAGPGEPGCLLIELSSCRFSELRLEERIAGDQILLPVLAIAAPGDVTGALAAMRAGAIDRLERPFAPDELVERVNLALARDRERRHGNVALSRILSRLERLTRREREVMALVAAGHPNKVIAQLLRISPRTVEVHRARVMEKMQARSVSELVRFSMVMDMAAPPRSAAPAPAARLTQ